MKLFRIVGLNDEPDTTYIKAQSEEQAIVQWLREWYDGEDRDLQSRVSSNVFKGEIYFEEVVTLADFLDQNCDEFTTVGVKGYTKYLKPITE